MQDSITFCLPDPDEALAEVKLLQEVRRPRVGPDFVFEESTKDWKLAFPRPDADRFEYMLLLVHKDGGTETIVDPANPKTAPGPFGAKSVVELPDYRPPAWVDADPVDPSTIRTTEIKSRALRARLPVMIWAPEGIDEAEPLPLLIAHDGPEYNELSDLLKLLAHEVKEGRLPPHRAGLIAPVERNQIYSASASYSRAFAYEILPALEKLAPTSHGRRARVGMGASLGALAMLHAHRTHPAMFGALFLQSGSYFRQRFDKQESGFVRFGRISRFMGKVLTAEDWLHPIPVTMTCGTIEENLANNRATAAALSRQGYDTALIVNRDGHNWVGWRDTFDPHLVDLLAKVWGTE
jgi:enterochelin esterase family protein